MPLEPSRDRTNLSSALHYLRDSPSIQLIKDAHQHLLMGKRPAVVCKENRHPSHFVHDLPTDSPRMVQPLALSKWQGYRAADLIRVQRQKVVRGTNLLTAQQSRFNTEPDFQSKAGSKIQSLYEKVVRHLHLFKGQSAAQSSSRPSSSFVPAYSSSSSYSQVNPKSNSSFTQAQTSNNSFTQSSQIIPPSTPPRRTSNNSQAYQSVLTTSSSIFRPTTATRERVRTLQDQIDSRAGGEASRVLDQRHSRVKFSSVQKQSRIRAIDSLNHKIKSLLKNGHVKEDHSPLVRNRPGIDSSHKETSRVAQKRSSTFRTSSVRQHAPYSPFIALQSRFDDSESRANARPQTQQRPPSMAGKIARSRPQPQPQPQSGIQAFAKLLKRQIQLDNELRSQKRTLSLHTALNPSLPRRVCEEYSRLTNSSTSSSSQLLEQLQSTADQYDPFTQTSRQLDVVRVAQSLRDSLEHFRFEMRRGLGGYCQQVWERLAGTSHEVRLQDLVSFGSVLLSANLRNRDLALLFKRLAGQGQALTKQAFMRHFSNP